MSSIFRIGSQENINELPIALDANILKESIEIIKGELSPGLGGHVRLWFVFTLTGGTPTAIKVITTKINVGTGLTYTIGATAGIVTGVGAVTTGGEGYKAGDLLRIIGAVGNDAKVRVLTVNANGGATSIEFVYGGTTGYVNAELCGTAGLISTGFVNVDQVFSIVSGGLYWYDVPISENLSINFQPAEPPDTSFSAATIANVELLEIQKIIFGA